MGHDVVIIGAGLAGLCCARRLHEEGVSVLIVEASDGVGGRVRTDLVDGFRLDRGFQVFLTSYPEAQRVLDYPSLDLKPFLPGASVRFGGKFHELTDPWRRPLGALRSVFSPIGSLADKMRVASVRSRVTQGSIEDRFHDPETTTLESLKEAGFSKEMIERFFRPFLAGIFLDPTLNTSSRMFSFIFRMFSLGAATLPAAGMEAIPRQLAAALPEGCVRLSARVAEVEQGRVTLDSGEELDCRTVVVATDGPAAGQLLNEDLSGPGQSVTCLYFGTPHPPTDKSILILNGEGAGPVNNLCVPTNVAPSYGPEGQSLVSATVLEGSGDENKIVADVREHLSGWFGKVVNDWRHLRTYRLPYALPRQFSPALAEPQRPVRWKPNLYVCGDHRDNASIQGAMVSGRRSAEAVLEDLNS
ncbi:NAD(P)/FAD-dependent oxidoreductase [Rubinisphaera margarita]|uniref:NAD(P)/FAD-dependent oxidoreductase n=1 Tax=Rubinisphaera margarita TaxID=2909586 RepID=UPI001EE80E0E|nr:NAD(P)/FAD-dependent oxidoreductase [Rubinisphaera margarita]MCG6158176.1 FAD-dependent oxidoreductase [Rubinisphaera margarita]